MRLLLLTIHCFILLRTYAQPGPDKLTKLPADTLPRQSLQYPAQVQQFYSLVKEPLPWMQQKVQQQVLLQFIQDAEHWGLPPQEYPFGYLDSLYNNCYQLPTHKDSLYADEAFTDAAIHFFHDMAIGNEEQPVSFAGWKYMPDCLDIPGLLALAVVHNLLNQLPEAMEPATPDYKALKKSLQQLLEIRKDTASETLIDRLSTLGILPYALHKNDLFKARQVLPSRIRELNEALNTVRWLRCMRESECILVNIPSATLEYYAQGKLLLQSKVVVGKRATPTSTLSSQINEIVLYPYWMVPSRIASHELLPLIKKNPAFLDDNGYQVISAGKVIDPDSIDWKKYSSTYFPFTLRQSTGCDNSLGIIKLNFQSPYGIYLHDTPWKSLFNLSRRYLSHGCVRVERVAELARLLLKDDSTYMDEIIQKGDSLNTRPTPLQLTQRVPVLIVYHTAWTDLSGEVRFYDDVYRKTTPLAGVQQK